MEKHLHEKHANSISPRQYLIFLDMCERPMDETSVSSCPFCPEEGSLMTLLNHIGEHLEEISLSVLPLNLSDGDEADADSQNSKNARRQESVVNASRAFSGSLSSLAFSDRFSSHFPETLGNPNNSQDSLPNQFLAPPQNPFSSAYPDDLQLKTVPLREQDNSPVMRARYGRGLRLLPIRTDLPILESRDDKAPGGF
jgi:hypothetical protein